MTETLPLTDAAMEVLCLLSPTPALLKDIAHDLGHPKPKCVRKLIEELRAAGVRVETGWGMDKVGATAWIPKKRFAAAYSMAEAWWDQREAK